MIKSGQPKGLPQNSLLGGRQSPGFNILCLRAPAVLPSLSHKPY
jgi:hypothetical protein